MDNLGRRERGSEGEGKGGREGDRGRVRERERDKMVVQEGTKRSRTDLQQVTGRRSCLVAHYTEQPHMQ